MMHRYGAPPDAGRRYTRRPGAYAIIADGGSILITEETGLEEPEFQLPGGGIDPDESPLGALHREVLEETGWRMRVVRHLATYQRYTFMPDYDLWAQKICAIYLCRPGPRHGPPSEAGHRAHWMPATEAVDLLASPGDAAVLSRWIKASGAVPGR